MGKIYTKKGDKGQTGTIGMGRVSKSDLLPEALGSIDELNSWIGFLRGGIFESELCEIQNNLMTFGSILAGGKIEIKSGIVKKMEVMIDKLSLQLPALSNFVYPRGRFHIARVVCRRCERAVVKHLEIKEDTTKQERLIKMYLNRLSDLLFVMARWVNKNEGILEQTWKK